MASYESKNNHHATRRELASLARVSLPCGLEKISPSSTEVLFISQKISRFPVTSNLHGVLNLDENKN